MAENKDWYILWIIKKSRKKTGTFKFFGGEYKLAKTQVYTLFIFTISSTQMHIHTMYMHTYMPGVYTKVFVTKRKKPINDLYVK